MRVFDNDCKLPALPVASLEETGKNLKMMIKPLVDEQTWQASCQAIDAFSSGEGKKLQEQLAEWQAQLSGNSSWLRPLWDDMCLSFRGSLPIFMNFDFQLASSRWGEDASAKLIAGLAQASIMLSKQKLLPEQAKDGYLAMDTLRSMFYTRIPNLVRDDFYTISLAGPLTAAVVCKGNWFILTLADECGQIAGVTEIAQALVQIKSECLQEAAPVGALTCCERDQAVALRSKLQENILNRTSIEQIEKALFVVCLDQPLGQEEFFGNRTLGGAAGNRWYDKSLQIICADDKIGANFEHAGCDAGIWVYLLSQADTLIRQDKLAQNEGKAHIRKLAWHVDNITGNELEQAAKAFASSLAKVQLSQGKLEALSKETIKAKRCSPDAFVQLLFQAAYYKLTGSFRSVYESVATRFFYQGRTECIRACTQQAKEFLLLFFSEQADKAALLEKFQQAIQAHKQVMSICQNGRGPERHMTGLLAMHQMSGHKAAPPIFADEGYLILKHDALSTSSVTAPCVEFFGFGPVVQDGIGVGYGITPDSLNLMVTAYPDSKIDPAAFIEEVDKVGKKLLAIV